MPEENLRLSRRSFLRTGLLGGTGLAAAYLLACSNKKSGGGTPTSTPRPTSPLAATPGRSKTLQWRMHAPPSSPSARQDHSLVSDGERLFLYGGRGDDALADLWQYDIAAEAWSQLTPAGGPGPRFAHSAAWHKQSSRMIVFGGRGTGESTFNDLWAFDPASSAWAQLPGEGPSPRYSAADTLDLQGRLIVTLGCAGQERFNDAWRYDFDAQAWTDITPRGGESPAARCLVRAAWTELQDQHLLMFGGESTDTAFLDDLWALAQGRGWTPVDRVPHPKGRSHYSIVFDETNLKITMFGGNSDAGPLNELWWFDATDEFWAEPPQIGAGPTPRFGHDAAWVAPRYSMFLFGGNGGGANLADLWELGPGPS